MMDPVILRWMMTMQVNFWKAMLNPPKPKPKLTVVEKTSAKEQA